MSTAAPPDGDLSGFARGTAEVWAACFADLETADDAWLACLDDAEQATFRRLRRPRDRLAYAGRHAMTRAVLGQWVGRKPADLRFTAGPFGKPALCHADAPFFSVSRTGEVSVVAVHPDTAIGVDIERPGPIESSLATLFAPSEQALLAGLSEPERTQVLFRLWVSKEAVLKASGHGLSLDPERVDVDLRNDGAVATPQSASPVAYHVHRFALPGGIIGAVAAERPVVPAVRWWRRCQWRADCSACTTSLMA